MNKYLSLIIFLIPFIGFSQNINDDKAKKIINQCVSAHGGKLYEKVHISFDFRQFHFVIKTNKGDYYYERTYTDSTGNKMRDVLQNGIYLHEKNGEKTSLSQKMEDRYRESVNSVAYFMLLPYKLKDKAVRSTYVGSTEIDGNTYDKIKVWFDQEGGGRDYEDIFCYWIHQKNHTLDYLAYSNGGPRFRKVSKRDNVGGIIFQNYDNYKILDDQISADQYDDAFLSGKASLLSKIEQTNYSVIKK